MNMETGGDTGLATLKQEIKVLLIGVSGMEMQPEDIDDEISLFQEGLGLDSIDVLEFVVRLDKNYGLKVLNDDAGRAILSNVRTIATAVRQGQST